MGTQNQFAAPKGPADDASSARVYSGVAPLHAVESSPTARPAAGTILRQAISFPILLAGLLVAGVFVGTRLNLGDPDTWWHIRVGQKILAEWQWPTTDPFSFTVSGNDWMAYEWLGEVLMGFSTRWGRLVGPTIMLIVVTASFMLLLYYYSYLRSGNVKAAFVASALVLPMAEGFFALRPQLIGYNFLLITLICLEHYRRGRRRVVWGLPVLFLVWVNTHGTFIFGLLVLGLFWVSGWVEFSKGGLFAERWTSSQRRQLATVMLLCLLVLPLTPYGTRLAAYPLVMSLSQPVNVANIQEWQPVGFDMFMGKVFLSLLLVFFLNQVIFPLKYRLDEAALLVFAAYAACVHLRFICLFLLVFTPLLAAELARWIPPYQVAKDQFVLNAALLGMIAVGLVVFFPSDRKLERSAEKRYPVKAVEYVRSHPIRGPMLNEYGWGGYMIWALSPQHKVFIDGRADIYEYAGVLTDYLHIVRVEPHTLALLRAYGIESCLIPRKAPLGTLLGALPDWEQVYADDVSVLFVRKQKPQAGGAGANNAPPAQAKPMIRSNGSHLPAAQTQGTSS
jgi:hypothetical protein